MIQSSCLQSQLLKECFRGKTGEHMPLSLTLVTIHMLWLPILIMNLNTTFRQNIISLFKTRCSLRGPKTVSWEVHDLLQNNLLEGSRGKGPGPGFLLKSVTLSDDGCVTRWKLVWKGAKDAGKVHSRFS